MGNHNVGLGAGFVREAQPGTQVRQPGRQRFRGADGNRRFNDNQVAFLQYPLEAFGGGLQVAEIGFAVIGERRRHGKNEGVRGFGLGGGAELSGADGVEDHLVQVRLDKVNLALVG